jgi:hypothetical protein
MDVNTITEEHPMGKVRTALEGGLEEEFGGDVEVAAEAFDVVFAEFALAAENFGDDAG